MVKGCKRSMIVVRDTGSAIFDEAYFLLKEEMSMPIPGQDALVREADRIIRERSISTEQKKSRRGGRRFESVIWFVCGLLCGVGAAFLMFAFG